MRYVLLLLVLSSCGSNKCARRDSEAAAVPVTQPVQQGSGEQPPTSPPPTKPPEMAGAVPLGQPSNDDLEVPAKPAGNAGSQLPLAWQLNQDGIAALKAGKPADASAKFREAVARIPDASYFLNLCISLYWEGKFGEALTACNAIQNSSPSPGVRTKGDKMNERIKAEAARQGVEIYPKSSD